MANLASIARGISSGPVGAVAGAIGGGALGLGRGIVNTLITKPISEELNRSGLGGLYQPNVGISGGRGDGIIASNQLLENGINNMSRGIDSMNNSISSLVGFISKINDTMTEGLFVNKDTLKENKTTNRTLKSILQVQQDSLEALLNLTGKGKGDEEKKEGGGFLAPIIALLAGLLPLFTKFKDLLFDIGNFGKILKDILGIGGLARLAPLLAEIVRNVATVAPLLVEIVKKIVTSAAGLGIRAVSSAGGLSAIAGAALGSAFLLSSTVEANAGEEEILAQQRKDINRRLKEGETLEEIRADLNKDAPRNDKGEITGNPSYYASELKRSQDRFSAGNDPTGIGIDTSPGLLAEFNLENEKLNDLNKTVPIDPENLEYRDIKYNNRGNDPTGIGIDTSPGLLAEFNLENKKLNDLNKTVPIDPEILEDQSRTGAGFNLNFPYPKKVISKNLQEEFNLENKKLNDLNKINSGAMQPVAPPTIIPIPIPNNSNQQTSAVRPEQTGRSASPGSATIALNNFELEGRRTGILPGPFIG